QAMHLARAAVALRLGPRHLRPLVDEVHSAGSHRRYTFHAAAVHRVLLDVAAIVPPEIEAERARPLDAEAVRRRSELVLPFPHGALRAQEDARLRGLADAQDVETQRPPVRLASWRLVGRDHEEVAVRVGR